MILKIVFNIFFPHSTLETTDLIEPPTRDSLPAEKFDLSSSWMKSEGNTASCGEDLARTGVWDERWVVM